eukprot:CAMPEP_0113670756 /NCGR_PEP_ID=MMETSP0038_2-20120614/5317_1 /TAXON_ID=2898 /ORGANISM="Cryptomonas paramecium" /LENGTH=67 /DNA_ID=CAMNT_0000586815 /DNA_START=554 /DNA_END=753 /DNA_ORIENTATION=+ /assembly_acc=CAM_ASM_000170
MAAPRARLELASREPPATASRTQRTMRRRPSTWARHTSPTPGCGPEANERWGAKDFGAFLHSTPPPP